MRTRSGVVLLDRDRVCLIQRVRNGRTYYLFPGGGVEPGETPEQAAAREALEELGVEVELERLVAEYSFRGRRQYYYLARIVGGRFGTGTGEEMSSSADSERGSYTPVWMTLEPVVGDRAGERPRARAMMLVPANLPSGGWRPLRIWLRHKAGAAATG